MSNARRITRRHIKEFNRRFYISDDFKLMNKIQNNTRALKGTEAGNFDGKGYRQVQVNREPFFTHRVIYSIFYNKTLRKDLDHIDRDGLNNSPFNLRKTTDIQNKRNRNKQKNNKSGVTGVYFMWKIGMWGAQIKINYKVRWLGSYRYKKDAIRIRKKAELIYGFTNG